MKKKRNNELQAIRQKNYRQRKKAEKEATKKAAESTEPNFEEGAGTPFPESSNVANEKAVCRKDYHREYRRKQRATEFR